MGLNRDGNDPGSDRTHASGRASLSPESVDLHIEEMMLHGFPAADRYRIGDAVRQELSRLLAEPDGTETLVQSGYRSMIDAGSIKVEPSMTPEAIGGIIAQSLHKGFRR